jgi:hypothetical protein
MILIENFLNMINVDTVTGNVVEIIVMHIRHILKYAMMPLLFSLHSIRFYRHY